MKMKSEFLTLRGNVRKNYLRVVVAAGATFLGAHALILKEFEGFSMLASDAVDGQRPGKLECEHAICSRYRAQTHAGGGLQRVVGGNRSLQGIMNSAKGRGNRRRVRQAMRGPDIIKSCAARFVNLPEQEWLIALTVKHNIERAGGYAFKT